jgi:GNAT superfamily N-acetyltransferase
MKVELHGLKDSPEARAILAGIASFNDRYRTDDLRDLTVFVRDDAGVVCAGLTGTTDWGWLFVRLFWVSESLRGQGVGTRLLDAAEAEARSRGCHSAWLDTFSFQAPGFYEKRGYARFGSLPEYPRGFERHFYWKKL